MTQECEDLGTLQDQVLIFGGPYSNLAATRAIRAEARRLDIPPQRVICTGDLVAYCADASATTELIRDWGIPMVMGNCEESLAADASDCGCGFEEGSNCSLLSVQWYRYASAQLSATQKQWMGSLPRSLQFRLGGKSFRVVHGSVSRINEFIFASSDELHCDAELQRSNTDVVIGGHCGLPFGRTLTSGYWLNSGVIGMPANDSSRDGWYLLLTPQEHGIQARWQRLSYDAEASAHAMQAAGLDSPYATALLSGLWPSTDILPAQEKDQSGIAIDAATLNFCIGAN
ncbi:metallophosphoesterase family protein [Marinobacterium jannaschii]|uniref:metallophosphoesterase family protein n=1 Tax=Marinobacterium jannaschii TaxID=64970 RepID=UPI00055E63AF|nr:metallophosphoesterase family protein [Marinobacterium jannaschii]